MGFCGSSHHATEDMAIIRSLANMTVISPADGQALSELIEESVVSYHGPIYFRVSRGREESVYTADRPKNMIGKANELREGNDLTLIACGITVKSALDAAEQLNRKGLAVREEWDLIFNINMKGVFHLTQEVMHYMKQRKYGRIVNLGSVSGKRGGGVFGGSQYSAAKAAVGGFSKAVAREGLPLAFPVTAWLPD